LTYRNAGNVGIKKQCIFLRQVVSTSLNDLSGCTAAEREPTEKLPERSRRELTPELPFVLPLLLT